MTPGIHPQSVNKRIIKKDPQPLSITDSGGKKIANNTRKKLIAYKLVSTSKRRFFYGFVTEKLYFIFLIFNI